MRLSKKTFLYSLTISLVLVAFVVLYFAFMLPSLFVAHEARSNLQSIADIQKGYMEKRNYDGLKVKNPTGCITVEIPNNGDVFYVAGKAFRVSVTVKDPQVRELLAKMKEYFSGAEKMEDLEEPDFDVDLLMKKLIPKDAFKEDYPLGFSVEVKDTEAAYERTQMKFHVISNQVMVLEMSAWDDANAYTTYLAMGKTSDAVILSVLPVSAPQMNGIQSIVVESLPMIAAVLFFLVLIFSQFFSKKIVNPVIRLAQYAKTVKTSQNMEIEPLAITEKDEIGELGRALNELYVTLRNNYWELEQRNGELAKENKRQEVFVRASSHQLKTPIAAAMLLVDGMIHEVGKYKDTKVYLPQVKEQLLSMQKMVEEMLYLSRSIAEIEEEPVDVDGLMKEVLREYQVQTEAKGIQVAKAGSRGSLITKRDILKKVVENLVSNAISYTPVGKDIKIEISQERLVIRNYGARIDGEIQGHIFEPFVGSLQKGSHGLGLYISSYCVSLLGYELSVDNIKNGVEAVLTFSS